ncbi:hypothetical protein C1H46_024598 [Malus baccata]|uniref:Uncharacterized protein n=1 Tax=Malus baccata TaxID=106549 RepID=A0A540LU82_MALBA|nr:hypothetical protein C1H46_024598 [Malus baccata]
MKVSDQDFPSCGFGAVRVALTPIRTPSSKRRLSSSFNERSRPVPARRKLAWVNLEGRMVNADEASSARAIKGGLSPEQAAAWELFTPFQRFLFVAVISVAAAESKKNRHISQLKKSVELRDQILSSMQQKLDSLCEQMNNIKDHSGTLVPSTLENVELQRNESFSSHKIKFVDCGCWLCDQHRDLPNGLVDNNAEKASDGDHILRYKVSLPNVQEQEERRMSDLSDLCSSVTSAADIQLNAVDIEQDIDNLKKDCEEKDGTIQELTTLLQSAESADAHEVDKRNHHMMNNILYDMDSTTGPSSSDSDCSPRIRPPAPPVVKTRKVPQILDPVQTTKKPEPKKASTSKVKPTNSRIKSHPLNPLKAITMNSRQVHSVSKASQPMSPKSQPASPKSQPMSPVTRSSTTQFSRPRPTSAGGDSKRTIRRRSISERKDAPPQKRWA